MAALERQSSNLRRGLRGFFGFAGGDLGLQRAVLGAAVDLLFAKAMESRGVATCFGHDFSFLKRARSDARDG